MFWNWTSLKFCRLVKSQLITRRQILDSSKLKEFAEDNFRFDKDGRKLSKQALVFTCLQYKSFENTVGKGEIAQKACFPGASKGVIVWEWVKDQRWLNLFTFAQRVY